jgi:hypothetical protein
VTTVPREPGSVIALTWLACGGTVVALAFAVHPVHTSREIFWAVASTGALVLLIGFGVVIRGVAFRRRRSDAVNKRRLLAIECRRVYDALSALINECNRARPRPALWMPSESRVEEWRLETAARYRAELSDWATNVFDDAVAWGAASPAARALVEASSAAQLGTVRDLFRDAADALGHP